MSVSSLQIFCIQYVSATSFSTSKEQRNNANLWFHIQNSDFALLMNLLDGLNFGAKHISLETAILQQLISRDALGHDFIGDEIVLLSVGLVLTLGSGGVCVEGAKTEQGYLPKLSVLN